MRLVPALGGGVEGLPQRARALGGAGLVGVEAHTRRGDVEHDHLRASPHFQYRVQEAVVVVASLAVVDDAPAVRELLLNLRRFLAQAGFYFCQGRV